jgi:hypothetical protein
MFSNSCGPRAPNAYLTGTSSPGTWTQHTRARADSRDTDLLRTGSRRWRRHRAWPGVPRPAPRASRDNSATTGVHTGPMSLARHSVERRRTATAGTPFFGYPREPRRTVSPPPRPAPSPPRLSCGSLGVAFGLLAALLSGQRLILLSSVSTVGPGRAAMGRERVSARSVSRVVPARTGDGGGRVRRRGATSFGFTTCLPPPERTRHRGATPRVRPPRPPGCSSDDGVAGFHSPALSGPTTIPAGTAR